MGKRLVSQLVVYATPRSSVWSPASRTPSFRASHTTFPLGRFDPLHFACLAPRSACTITQPFWWLAQSLAGLLPNCTPPYLVLHLHTPWSHYSGPSLQAVGAFFSSFASKIPVTIFLFFFSPSSFPQTSSAYHLVNSLPLFSTFGCSPP